MSTIVNLEKTLEKAIEIFNSRNRALWNAGMTLLLLAFILAFLFRHLLVNQHGMREKAGEWPFWIGFVGTALVLLCFSTGIGHGLGLGDGTGIGIGDGIGILGVDNLTSFSVLPHNAPPEEQAAQQCNSDKALYVRVHGTAVYVEDIPCEDTESIRKKIEGFYTDDLDIIVIDDYADNTAFENVAEILKNLGIQNYRVEMSKKEA